MFALLALVIGCALAIVFLWLEMVYAATGAVLLTSFALGWELCSACRPDSKCFHSGTGTGPCESRESIALAALPAITWTTDCNFSITTFANGGETAAEQVDAIGRHISALFGTELGKHAEEESAGELESITAHRRALAGLSTGFAFRPPSVDQRAYEAVVQPLRGDSGAIVGCIGVAIDVTTRRRAGRAAQHRRDLQGAVAALDQVFTVIGHELRTPLAALRVMTEHLLDEQDSAGPQHEYLDSIHTEIVNLSDLVNDLLDVAQIPRSGVQWDFTRVAVAELCEEAVGSIRSFVDQNSVEVLWAVDPPDLSFIASPCGLLRLISNLLTNAQRHTRRGRIELRASRVDECFVEFVVRDTGSGISELLTDKLGVPFALNAGMIGGGVGSQYENDAIESRSSHDAVIGCGFGLALCERIAAAHGGTLRFESEAGTGTAVTVRIRADLIRDEAVVLQAANPGSDPGERASHSHDRNSIDCDERRMRQ